MNSRYISVCSEKFLISFLSSKINIYCWKIEIEIVFIIDESLHETQDYLSCSHCLWWVHSSTTGEGKRKKTQSREQLNVESNLLLREVIIQQFVNTWNIGFSHLTQTKIGGFIRQTKVLQMGRHSRLWWERRKANLSF